MPGAPLRALSYASAGGRFASLDGNNKPMSALLKFGYKGDGCVYSRKIVMLDEAHNLTRGCTMYGRQLAELRRLLSVAQDSVVAAFTGTPVSDDPRSGARLLEVVKGVANQGRSDEGFVASLVHKGPPLFPVIRPKGVPNVELTDQLRKRLCPTFVLTGQALRAYDAKVALGELSQRQLQVYCNMASHCTAWHGFHRDVMLTKPGEWMPKFAAIANAVVQRREKAAVLVSRQGGYAAMLAYMRQVGAEASPPIRVASTDRLAEFNASSNAHGEAYMVLIADAAQFSEGSSFRAVRRLYLADIPSSAVTFQQQVGRAARMFGHHDLPLEDRSLTVVLPCATFPAWMKSDLAAWCLRVSNTGYPDASEDVSAAQRLLRRFRARGVANLEELKTAVDNEVAASSTRLASVSADMASPLGMDAAVRLLRRWGVRAPPGAAAAAAGLPPVFSFKRWAFHKAHAPGRGKGGRSGGGGEGEGVESAQVADDAASGGGDGGASTTQRAAGGEAAPTNRAAARRRRSRLLVRALQALALKTSAAEEAAGLSKCTADEAALDTLAARLAAQVPALADLRSSAIVCHGEGSSRAADAADAPTHGVSTVRAGAIDSATNGTDAGTDGCSADEGGWGIASHEGFGPNGGDRGSGTAGAFAATDGLGDGDGGSSCSEREVDMMSRVKEDTSKRGNVAWQLLVRERRSQPTKPTVRTARSEVFSIGKPGCRLKRPLTGSTSRVIEPPIDGVIADSQTPAAGGSCESDLEDFAGVLDEALFGHGLGVKETPLPRLVSPSPERRQCDSTVAEVATTKSRGRGRGKGGGDKAKLSTMDNDAKPSAKKRRRGTTNPAGGELSRVAPTSIGQVVGVATDAAADLVDGEESLRFTPATVDKSTCLARTWSMGRGGQCPRRPLDGSVFCGQHMKNDAWHSHGRVDGPIPEAKLRNFQAAARAACDEPRAAPSSGEAPRRKKRLATAQADEEWCNLEPEAFHLGEDARELSQELKAIAVTGGYDEVGDDMKRFTPDTLDLSKCLARTWANGHGGQCTGRPSDGQQFCPRHGQGDAWQVHGRVDGPIPEAKLREFMQAEKRRISSASAPLPGEAVGKKQRR
eukprot:TRINITY_DN67231_c0_g1_i1.p1 TRINITY_DN67231_c0_g1~~TRINITY_DN67231_c0_g1_i1.p1  ORF type:complete len:1171 (-),score=216.39 TRINITY_DN67231_c0_g1_i1:663-3953(-)